MNTYQELKQSYESSSKMLTLLHKRIYSLCFGILGTSLLISQTLLHTSKDTSLFFTSSYWMLIAGLPILGSQLKRGKKIDQKITETLLQGLHYETIEKSGGYFFEKACVYQKHRKFLLRALPMWALCGLIIAWSRVMLKNIGPSTESTQTMAYIGTCLGILALYVFVFTSSPYRKFQADIKKAPF